MLFAIWYMNDKRETNVVIVEADSKSEARAKANKLDYVKVTGLISQVK